MTSFPIKVVMQLASTKTKMAKLQRGSLNKPSKMINCSRFTLLCFQHEACNRGHAAVARMLLDNGAMMNVPGLDNDTPLHDAVSNGRIDCVKLLISRGASLSAR